MVKLLTVLCLVFVLSLVRFVHLLLQSGSTVHDYMFKLFNYGQREAFVSKRSEQHTIQLAFSIMIYGKLNQDIGETINDFTRLMDVIHDDFNHIYILHIDSKSDPSIHKYVNRYCSSKLNCHSIEARSITWAGVSVTEMNLALMQAADQFRYLNGSQSSWEYFILLGEYICKFCMYTYI